MLYSRAAASRTLHSRKSRALGFMVAGVAIALFATGGVVKLHAHRGFAGSTAWAEQPDGSADDGDIAADPTVPDINGSYTGTLDDHRNGGNSLSAIIGQRGPKLFGTWSSSDDGGITGNLKGKVKANGEVKMKLKIDDGNLTGCALTADGTFEDGDEISGVYHLDNCAGPDHGTFDMTQPPQPPPQKCGREGSLCGPDHQECCADSVCVNSICRGNRIEGASAELSTGAKSDGETDTIDVPVSVLDPSPTLEHKHTCLRKGEACERSRLSCCRHLFCPPPLEGSTTGRPGCTER
jgi:hypothetical protein